MFDLQSYVKPEMVAHAIMKFKVISKYVASLGPAWDMSNHVSMVEKKKKKYFEKLKQGWVVKFP